MRRVVVTGIGMVSPLGVGTKKNWDNLISSKSGVRKIEHFEISDLPCKIAGQVPSKDMDGGFDPDLYIPVKDQRKMDRFIHLGMAASIEAVEDAGIADLSDEEKDMIGVIIGSGIGGLPAIEESSIFVKDNGPRRLSPFFIPSALINLVSGHVSIKYGFRGPNHAVVTACSTGAHAIGDASRLIQFGDANIMVAGGAEAAVCRIGIAGFAAARTLSTSFNDTPERASRPYDRDRDGFVMGEGAGIVVLEEYEHAKKRGAKIYGELVGYGLTGDAYHITAPHPEGRGGFRAMQSALKRSGLSTSDIGYINAHGTSTPLGDGIELKAVEDLFGADAAKVSMSSTKSSIGHLLGAAGSVEAIYSLLALNSGILPPTLNLENQSIETKIDLIPLKAKEKKVDAVLSNSFGFGGTNACLILKKAQ